MVEDTVQNLLCKYKAVECGHFILASGATSTCYVDVKSAMTNPELLQAIAIAIADKAACDMIAGVAVGGIPLAVATSLATGLPYAIIRSNMKDHGKGGTIIGDVKGKRVLLVEDVTTSGESALYGITELRNEGAIVDTVICVVDRGSFADETLNAAGVRLIPLTKLDELVKQQV